MNSDQPSKSLYTTWQFYIGILATVLGVFIFTVFTSVVSLRWINPPVTSFILQQNWEELEADRYNLREWWVPGEDIPDHMKWAVISSEDQLFYEHNGFDIESIRDAYEEYREGTRVRGASTITQQVAKNLYLWPGQSFFRKGIEAGFTVLIELFLPKERILEIYLNIAEFGPGIFGLGKASDAFFDLSASQIEPDMAARLASVLPSPKRMRVEPPSPFAEERSRWVLAQMSRLSGISYMPELPADSLPDIDPIFTDSLDVFKQTGVSPSDSDTSSPVIKIMEFPRELYPNLKPDSLTVSPADSINSAADTLQSPPDTVDSDSLQTFDF